MNRYIRLPEVIDRTGLAKSTIYLKIKSGNFPPPVKLGTRASGWRDSDITKWQENPQSYTTEA